MFRSPVTSIELPLRRSVQGLVILSDKLLFLINS